MQKLPSVISDTSASPSYISLFSPVAFANAENDLRKSFSSLCVVEVCPSSVAVVASFPSQRHVEPPVCAALILSA